jgi:hypothetical protein
MPNRHEPPGQAVPSGLGTHSCCRFLFFGVGDFGFGLTHAQRLQNGHGLVQGSALVGV